MAEHDMKLDDQLHRTLYLNTELCDTAATKVSVYVVYKKSSSGNMTNFILVKSLKSPKAFADLEIEADGVKIPPDVPAFTMKQNSN